MQIRRHGRGCAHAGSPVSAVLPDRETNMERGNGKKVMADLLNTHPGFIPIFKYFRISNLHKEKFCRTFILLVITN